MLRKFLLIAALICCCVVWNGTSNATTINITGNKDIHFNGNATFDLGNPGTFTSISGYTGEITGTFTIGAISGNSAPVTGTGDFQLKKGSETFDGSLEWKDILFVWVFGGLNYNAKANLTPDSGQGPFTDAFLNELLQGGITTLSFQFTVLKTLEELKTTELKTSWSGSISAVPIPGGLLALGMVRLLAHGRRQED